MGICNPTLPQTDGESAGSCSTNRFVLLQEDDEDSDATADVAPTPGIVEENQEGVVLVQPDPNRPTGDAQQQVAEPEVEGGIVPHEENPQPDGVISSKDADVPKAKSE